MLVPVKTTKIKMTTPGHTYLPTCAPSLVLSFKREIMIIDTVGGTNKYKYSYIIHEYMNHIHHHNGRSNNTTTPTGRTTGRTGRDRLNTKMDEVL